MPAVIDLAALPPTVVVPGIAHWLGYQPAVDDEPEETWESFCQRISKETR